MKKHYALLLFLLFSLHFSVYSIEKQKFRVMCYNVENFFDCIDDSLTNDAEYLPGGMRGWNYQKYQTKQANIGKVITAIGGWEAPALVGLCEVESEKCLFDLTRSSGLKNLKYRFVHYESPDARGVDVALLYQPQMFKPIAHQPIRISYPDAPNSKTRDILYVSGAVPTGDTLHVFVCHFPSRLGGELESEERRMYVASVLKQQTDSIFTRNNSANMIIMGDFNDYPDNKSMSEVLGAIEPSENLIQNQLYNLMYPLHKSGKGSHKHAGQWGALDQIIVSGNLLNLRHKFNSQTADVHIFYADFLLEDDKNFLGKQPLRTYVGMKYQGGFADHLPVYIDFWY
jgi:predicted extracellular nuclease